MHKRLFLFLFLSMAILFGWTYLQSVLFPPPKPADKPEPFFAPALIDETARLAKAGAAEIEKHVAAELKRQEFFALAIVDEAGRLAKLAGAEAYGMAKEAEAKSLPPIKLGDDGNSNLYVEIDARNATVKSITLNRFYMLDFNYARPVMVDGKHKPRLLMSDESPSDFTGASTAGPRQSQSFDLYTRVGDSLVPVEWDRWEEATGRVPHGVVFKGRLANGIRVTKTMTLLPDQYHLGLELTFEKGEAADPKFKYELSGPRGMIPEGTMWADRPFRQVAYGTPILDAKGEHRDFKRWLIDPLAIKPPGNAPMPTLNAGADPAVLQYAGVMMSHFSSLIIVDGNPADLRYGHQVYADYLGEDEGLDENWKKYGGKVSVRVASGDLALTGSDPITHKYLLYAGPSKVMLLNYEANVQPGLVDKYDKEFRLDRLTDSPSDWWLPNFFWNIGWTKLIIMFTNFMHMLLEWLHALVGHYGVAIILMTIMVRAAMFPVSRKQAQISQRMQDKMAALAPERQKIREKFKDNAAERQKAEMDLFRKHGVNPLGGCAGCLILLIQMPIFMGLYYALQESVHLRQAGFLWIENLSAPDMMFNWGNLPVFQWMSRGFLRLGDWFNLLPLISIVLMVVQQKMMTPTAMTDEQAAQMKMMNYMMIFMGYMFYWLYSGLCLYFIVSSLWGVLERKLVPKLSAAKPGAEVATADPAKGKNAPKTAPAPSGFRKRLSNWWNNLLEQAQKKNK